MAKAKAGPVVTDNGGMIIDWYNTYIFLMNSLHTHFLRYWDKQSEKSWRDIESALHGMPGLVETGLFVGIADTAYFGMQDGTVMQRDAKA